MMRKSYNYEVILIFVSDGVKELLGSGSGADSRSSGSVSGLNFFAGS